MAPVLPTMEMEVGVRKRGGDDRGGEAGGGGVVRVGWCEWGW